MTCRELLQIEHPDKCHGKGGCVGCPMDYRYAGQPEYCKLDDFRSICAKCWDREVDLKATGMRASNNSHVETETYVINTEPLTDEPHILDSGDRTEFESGAVRDMRVGKGRCDLLPLDVAYNISAHPALGYIASFVDTGGDGHLYNAIRESRIFPDINTMLLEVAKHFEEGANKYGDDNWKKGIPTNVYIDSAVRHYLKFLRGDKDEPHDRAFCWNILCCIWTCIHKPELNVYGKLDKGE